LEGKGSSARAAALEHCAHWLQSLKRAANPLVGNSKAVGSQVTCLPWMLCVSPLNTGTRENPFAMIRAITSPSNLCSPVPASSL
jgi:hypothetical protein